MVEQATTTATVDENGRITIPKGAREALDILDTRASLEIEIEVLERYPDGDTQ